jgi:ribosomal protein L35
LKRFKITKNKKLMKKTCGQDHYNSREPGKVTRSKRRLGTMSSCYTKNIKTLIPYNN